MNNLSNSIANWLASYQEILSQAQETGGAKIGVSDAAGKLAFIYEKIRNTVDYRDEHLLHKHATARIIRRIAQPGNKGSDIALPLIEELIRARYLPNDTLPETIISRVQHVINKYIVIYNSIVDNDYPLKELRDFFNWLIDLAACEVEEMLVPTSQEKLSIDAMYRVVKQSIILNDRSGLDESKKDIQIYVAVLKSLIKADEMTVNYYLIKHYFPNWRDLSLAEAAQVAQQVKEYQGVIKQDFSHHLNDKLTREFKRYNVVFWILQDIVQANPTNYAEIFTNRQVLVEKIKEVCNEKYKSVDGRVRRAIVRSVIYIFLTKMVFGLLLEFPYDLFILKSIHWLSLGVNALFPPLLMAAVGMGIKIPTKPNTDRIIQQVDNIVYNQEGEEHRIRIARPKRDFVYIFLQFLYLIMYVVSFGLIILGLNKLNFSPASIIIFLFFLTMVSFFSLRIRRMAMELVILQQRERLLTVIVSFLFVPILRVGRWISMHSSKINVFIFLLDFIIETPFKMFIRIFEDLIVFVKEKRDEML